jgi:uncharacterized protein
MMPFLEIGRIWLNALVGFTVGLAGGLIGLGGAELRLPYLAGTLKLPLKTAVPVNLAVSLITLAAALPTRLLTLNIPTLAPFAHETIAVAIGAVLAAYVGVSGLRRLSQAVLRRAVFVLLLVLGASMIAEAAFSISPVSLVTQAMALRLLIAFLFGITVGAVSGLLGVAGGEIIIPTLIIGFGVPIKAAGSLSQMVSIPTVLTGVVRHIYGGAFGDRQLTLRLIVPMGLGAIAGGIIGGLVASVAPANFLKVLLGLILIGSAIKVFSGTNGKTAAPVPVPSRTIGL